MAAPDKQTLSGQYKEENAHARQEDKMFELRRPEPKAALTWIAVLFIALIGLALVPMSGTKTELAGGKTETQYSSGSSDGHHGAISFVRQGKG